MTRLFAIGVCAVAVGLALPALAQTDEQLNQQELSRITSAAPPPALPAPPPPAPAYPAPSPNAYAACYDAYGNWTGYCSSYDPYAYYDPYDYYGGVGVAFFGGHGFRHGHFAHFGGHGGDHSGGHGGGHGGGHH